MSTPPMTAVVAGSTSSLGHRNNGLTLCISQDPSKLPDYPIIPRKTVKPIPTGRAAQCLPLCLWGSTQTTWLKRSPCAPRCERKVRQNMSRFFRKLMGAPNSPTKSPLYIRNRVGRVQQILPGSIQLGHTKLQEVAGERQVQ